MGKSRLVYELSQIVDADPELITWRQGRCLAYGDGVAFWALAEVVKAQAGISDRDTETEAAEKLHSAVEDAFEEAGDARWVESHLRPLSPPPPNTGLGGDRRGEAFAAWRRFLDALAEQRPLVLVLEDLHWADEGLLDFVDELVDWLSAVPLLVVCSARPELLERRPGWGGGKLNASTFGLSPLSQEQTAVLISHVLERTCSRPRSSRRCWSARRATRSTQSSSRSSISNAARQKTCLFPRRCRGSSPPASTASRPTRRQFSRMPR
jgi:predicted ATPase